jgi:hypothetical protein
MTQAPWGYILLVSGQHVHMHAGRAARQDPSQSFCPYQGLHACMHTVLIIDHDVITSVLPVLVLPTFAWPR